MKRLGLVYLLIAVTAALAGENAAPRSAAEIRKEMTAIRRSTDWNNLEQAAKAKEKMAQLAQELAGAGSKPSTGANAAAGGNATPTPSQDGVDPARFRLQLAAQMAEAASKGKNADVLLAKQVREEIVEEYKADVDPTIKNPDVLAEQTMLVIDFSSPAAEAVVKQMENFRGITTLVLTGGRTGAPVDLPSVLRKAAGYPLRELYIIDFRQHVTDLPPEATAFTQLQVLAVFDNAIAELHPGIAKLDHLDTLFVDANPLGTVLPVVRSLPKLTRLGLGKTGVSNAEQAEIRRLLPGCNILMQ
jgi:hypothetical protein